jgi:hypothetical protein
MRLLYNMDTRGDDDCFLFVAVVPFLSVGHCAGARMLRGVLPPYRI